MPTSNKRKRNKNPPTELNWVIKNQEQLSHITFFDFFQTYTRHTVTRRFRFVVEYYFNENKKNELFNQYNQWKKTGAAKIYWQQREAARSDGFSQMIQFRPDENTSTSETSAVDTEVTSSDVTSFTPEEITTVCTSEISIDEATSSISSTIRQPGENNCHVVNGLNIPFCFYAFQISVKSLLTTASLSFESNLQHILSLSSILLSGKIWEYMKINFLDQS